MVRLKEGLSSHAIIVEMKNNYRVFLEDCEALTQAQALKGGICGDWSAKAVINHLTGWQEASPSFIQDLLSSENPVFDVDIDAFNQNSVHERQALSWKESLAAFKNSFEAFEQALKDIPNARFETNAGLKSWVKAMNHEYVFHCTHIKNAQER